VDQPDHFTRRGMAARLPLGEDALAVHIDVEDAARGADHLDLDAGKLLLQLSRQTGGSGLVVSDDAVFDPDVHGRLAVMVHGES
jgi:hypothetical protein